MRVMLYFIHLKHILLKGIERSATVKYSLRAEAYWACWLLETSQIACIQHLLNSFIDRTFKQNRV